MYCVYILTNTNDSVLYIGFTGNINERLDAHKNKIVPGFTETYNLHKLVYIETTDDRDAALAREKQLKRWSREKKVWLIQTRNPQWNDLTDTLVT